MAWNIIPLDSTPNQEFNITVPVGEENVAMVLHLTYNTEGDFWRMDVSDGNTGEMLISAVPLLTGEYPAADILGQFGYVGIGSALVLKLSDATALDYPDIDTLGSEFVLVWGTEDEG